MELNGAGPDNQVRVQDLFKNFDRGAKAGFPYIPAALPVVLDAAEVFENFIPYKLPALFFGLFPVQAQGKNDSDILIPDSS